MSKQLTKATALTVQKAAAELADADFALRHAGLDIEGLAEAVASEEGPVDIDRHRDTGVLKREATAYVKAYKAHEAALAKAAKELRT